MNDNNNQGLIDLATKLVSEIGDQLNQQDTINKILPTSVIERYTKILNEHIKTLEGINLQTAAAELKVLKENFEEHLQNNEKLQNNNNNNNNNNNEDFKNLATKLVSEISDQLSQQDAINKILPTSVIERYTKIMNDHVESLEGANLQTATTELKVLKEDFEEHLQNNEKLQDIKDRINEQLGGAIEKTEKWGDKLKAAVSSPASLIGGSLIAAGFAIEKIGSLLKDINHDINFAGQNTVAIVKQLTATNVDLLKNIRLGSLLSGKVLEVNKAILNEYGKQGIALQENINLATRMVTDYSLSADQASKLVSLTRDNATNIKNSIDYLGNIHKIAPAAIAADLADNTELFALYAKKGGGNIIRAAIAAKELGMGLSEVGSIANKLLDIESSIAAEMEVSILLGRQINLDKARQLALTNDLDGMMEEITNQLGNQNEWNNMNLIQRQSLADAIGVSVYQLNKMYKQQKQLGQETGFFNKSWNKILRVLEDSSGIMGNILKKSGGVIAILGNLSLVKQSMGSGSRNKNLFAWILTPITAIGRAAKNTGAILSNKLGDAINGLARSAQRSGKAMTKWLAAPLQKFSNLFKKSGKAVQKTSAAFESSGDKITKNSKKMSKGFKSINFGQLAGAALVMLAFAGSIWILSKALAGFEEHIGGIYAMIGAMAALTVAVVAIMAVLSMLSVAAGPLIAVSAIFLAFGAAIYLVAQGLKTLSDSIDGLQKLAEIAPSLLLAAQALTVLSASLLMLGTASTTMMLFVIPLSLTILLIDKLTNKLTNSISNINAFSQSLYNLASLASSLTLVATSLQMISQAVGSLQNYLNDNELEIIINYKLGKNLSQQNTADQLYNNNESAAQLIGQSVQEGNQYYDNNSNIDVSDITATNKEILSQLKVLTKLTKEREYEVKITNGHRIGKLIARDS